MKREFWKLIADAVFGPIEAWKILFLLTVGLAVDWASGNNRLIGAFPYPPWIIGVAVLILWWVIILLTLANRPKRGMPETEGEKYD